MKRPFAASSRIIGAVHSSIASSSAAPLATLWLSPVIRRTGAITSSLVLSLTHRTPPARTV
jgi:hypothetical protein